MYGLLIESVAVENKFDDDDDDDDNEDGVLLPSSAHIASTYMYNLFLSHFIALQSTREAASSTQKSLARACHAPGT